jgi:predicted DNA binding CopG/RHH family protein
MRKKIYHERFDIRLPKDLYNASKKYANNEGLTLSQLIRNLLKDRIRIEEITKTLK